MKIQAVSGICLALFLVATAGAQQTNLTRSEVAAIKAKVVTVQQAMGGDPSGYLKESEEYSLPTEANTAQAGKFWPITAGVSLRYTDRGSAEGQANMEKMATEYQAKMAAAVASGDMQAISRMSQELTQMQAAAMAPPVKKDDMSVSVRLNQNPTAGIDPDAVVLERPGVIALRDKGTGERGDVTVYIDPVSLKATEELSKVELRTAEGGVTNKTGVFHVVIQLNGTLTDLESWVKTFDFDAMLGVIDPQ